MNSIYVKWWERKGEKERETTREGRRNGFSA